MITLKPVVHTHQLRKDKTFPVKIRVTFAGKCRYLPTTITCPQKDVTRSLKIKNVEAITAANALCDRMRSVAAKINSYELEGRDVDWVVRQIKTALRKQDFSLDFFAWADEFLQGKGEGNRRKYDTALAVFERFIGERKLDINDITHSMLVAFAEDCDSGCKWAYSRHRGVIRTDKPRTRKISPQYLSRLSHIFEAAKDKYNDEDGGAVVIPRSPFRKLDMTPPRPTSAQKPVPLDVLQAMVDAPASDPCRFALDAFLVGFGLYGANMADLWEAEPARGRWWAYDRRKTRNRRADRAHIVVEVAPELGPFLARLGAGSSAAYWLPVLHDAGTTAAAAGQSVNRGLRTWCAQHGFSGFTFYAGRHSWATYARRAGVEKATVDEGLGHIGDYRIADIYAERDWTLVAEANRKVLALLRWQ